MRNTIKTPAAPLVLIAAAACLLAVCAVSASADAGGAAADAPPVKGKVHPTGIATWFGPGFYGKQTACGQTLTPSVIGVANRTLPCGTLIEVTYGAHTVTLPVL